MQPTLKELSNKCPYFKLTRMLSPNYIQMHHSLKTIVPLMPCAAPYCNAIYCAKNLPCSILLHLKVKSNQMI